MSDPRRSIPSADALLGDAAFDRLRASTARPLLLGAVRDVLNRVREEAGSGAAPPSAPAEYAARVETRLSRGAPSSLRPVLNATGVVLHTNLGRAPLADAALAASERIARGYSNLEYDLERGERGSRYDHCADLLCELTGAEAALVVNNNAAAVVLALNTLALKRDVIVSRGEMVEIGGSFRIADVVERSGARVLEVGATNRTHLADYERAITPRTAAMLKVHRSNFSVSGFASEVTIEALTRLGAERDVPVVHDLGSGLLDRSAVEALAGEPTARGSIEAGAAVVTMSGDKLLGGPQAGLIVGRRALVDAMRANPLCRALRVDRVTLAALAATLALHGDAAQAAAGVPALRMLALPLEALRERAHALARRLGEAGLDCDVRDGESAVGGGAAPDVRPATALVLVRVDGGADAGLAALRAGEPPVVARVVDGRVALDLRTVPETDEAALIDAVVAALGGGAR